MGFNLDSAPLQLTCLSNGIEPRAKKHPDSGTVPFFCATLGAHLAKLLDSTIPQPNHQANWCTVHSGQNSPSCADVVKAGASQRNVHTRTMVMMFSPWHVDQRLLELKKCNLSQLQKDKGQDAETPNNDTG